MQEDDGSDTPVQSLRACLQQIERSGMVDFQLGGHNCERPAQVFNGHQDDTFLDLLCLTCRAMWPTALLSTFLEHSQLYFSMPDVLRFTVSPKSDAPLVWKANTVQLRSLKSSNCASYAVAETLMSSPALDVDPQLIHVVMKCED